MTSGLKRQPVLLPRTVLVWCGAALVVLLAVMLWKHGATLPRASGPLSQQAYVWQRQWNDDVRQAITNAAGRFDEFAVLGAEVGWDSGRVRVVRIAVDDDFLQNSRLPIGLALRIGPYAGPFAESGEPADTPAALAVELVRQAGTAGLTVKELQLDFDCAESKLDGYRHWVSAVRRRIAPVPLVITALPSWLNRSAFKPLAASTDGFVLQVHSLEKPRGADQPMTLCDPAAARKAVEAAGRVGVPFRVALATYGYFVGFGPQGQLVGLQAEGPSLAWPADTVVRVLRADPAESADLVRGWTADRPANLCGLIWYRLPTDTDTLNWRWPTLEAVMAGREPQGKLQAAVRRPEPALTELDLLNSGEADTPLPIAVAVTWRSGRLVAADALVGFELEKNGPEEAVFRRMPDAVLQWLAVGQRRPLGWLRFDVDTEVEVHVMQAEP